LLGHRGVEQYRLVRKAVEIGNRNATSLTDIKGDDCFHNGEDVSLAVKDWHSYLRHSLRENDKVTGFILTLIDEKVLLRSGRKRISLHGLTIRLREILDPVTIGGGVDYQPPSS